MDRSPLLYVHVGLPGTTNKSDLVTLTFHIESGVRVTCDVGYLCANLGLSVLELGPMYATDRQTDRQTDVRQTSD